MTTREKKYAKYVNALQPEDSGSAICNRGVTTTYACTVLAMISTAKRKN